MKRVCPVDGCQERIPAYLLMCRSHWRRVPKELQANVLTLNRRAPRSVEHLAACRDAIRSVEAAA